MKQLTRVFSVGALLLLCAGAQAQKNVGADIESSFDQRKSVTTGTSGFFVYSNQTKRAGVDAAVGPNADKLHTMSGPGNAFQDLSNTLAVAPGIANSVAGRTTSPVLGVNNRAKPANPYDRETVGSTSGAFRGFGSVNVKSARTAKDAIYASASCVDDIGAAGAASAIVYDPYAIDPGIYSIYNHAIDMTLINPGAQDFGGVLYAATDSRYTDPLWELQVWADHPVLTADDLNVQFTFNPEAMADGVLTDSTFTLTDSAMEARIRSNIDLSSGLPTLTGFNLFPDNVVYNVSGTEPIQYGVNSGAALALDTPEPGAFALLAGLGIPAGLLVRKRRKNERVLQPNEKQ